LNTLWRALHAQSQRLRAAQNSSLFDMMCTWNETKISNNEGVFDARRLDVVKQLPHLHTTIESSRSGAVAPRM
jgi:hypothetical protein